MEYTPDAWVILKLTNHGEVHYRLMAGWYGGYGGSDSWKVNSGITQIIDAGNYYKVYGHTGSCYLTHKEAERMTGYMASIFHGFASENSVDTFVEHISFTDLPKELFSC